ncbi:hypothetical protein FNL37_2175 [Methylovorus glucosotrophus]|uniref:hypothetical protein n=1 Tax=Methylovorus glucosotrophus TaxID=266009 RepID=UPI00133155BE|nr:hypothetical protein [Methylovorus glucosotrophus]KAF0844722.1 hypothetical protein FNL37_2175 [Methylovorus glucosotrophus]
MDDSLDKHVFLAEAREAVSTHIAFSRFVRGTESLCGSGNPFLSGEDISRFDKLWFELEIVNAGALSDWEDQGKPANWINEWEATYKPDAVELIENLVVLLQNK